MSARRAASRARPLFRAAFFLYKPGRPVQVAYMVFNKGQSARYGQFTCIVHGVGLIFEKLGFYHSSGARPVGVAI